MASNDPPRLRALRGATTVEVDDRREVHERVGELLGELFERNDIEHDDVVSVIFTATSDINSAFPAAGARAFGLGDVPLLCARELEIDGSKPRCIRVLIHLETTRSRAALEHVYLHEARDLRDDLPG